MEFEISLDYAIEDLEAYWRAFVWKKPGTPPQKQASPRMHRNAGLVFLALGALLWILIAPLAALPELIVGGLLLYSGWYLGRPGAASRWAKKNWGKLQESGRLYQCCFTEEGVWIHDSRSDCRYDYERLESLWEDGDRFYLVLSRRGGSYILSKERFTAGAPEDLPGWWEERTGKPVERVL